MTNYQDGDIKDSPKKATATVKYDPTQDYEKYPNIKPIKEGEPGLGFVDGNLSYDELQDKVPYLAGSFTGWRYK